VLFEDGVFRERLEQRGLAVSVLAASAAFRAISKESWLANPAASGSLVTLALELARKARRHDLLFCNTQKAFFIGALAGALSRRPVVFYLHDLLSDEHFSPFKRRLIATWANRFARSVLANSRATLEAFRDAGGRTPGEVLYNRFDAAAIDDARPLPDLRSALGVGDRLLIGVFSRLAPWKGQHVVLDALARVPDAHVAFVGAGLFGEEPYERQLKQRTRELGLQRRAHFLGFREDVPRLMKSVDVVVHSSVVAEPFGRVIVEGMLSRRAVVATEGGGVPEIIRHGDTGWLVPRKDPDRLSAVLQHLSAHPMERARIAERGYRDARHRFARRDGQDAFDRMLEAVG
jgi:glycosyltransferase involved in cell wall biosynthesis